MEGEPSASETVLDLQLGDMVLDVKKLDKQSSFNIESPVGTAGIRGTIPYLQVMETKEGGFNQTTSMLEGELAFTPKGSDEPILLGPGDSLTIGILPNGVMIPPTFKTLTIDMRNAIESDSQNYLKDDDSPVPARRASEVESTDETEQQEQKNDADPSRAAKSAGADNNGSAAVGALADVGLIDSATDENALIAVEAIGVAADIYSDKKAPSNPNGAQRYRRNNNPEKDDQTFLGDLVSNFSDVVEVTAEAEELGVKSKDLIAKTAENAENAPITNSNMAKVKDAGVDDVGALKSLISEPANSDEAAEFIDEALKVDPAGGSSTEATATKLGAVARSTSVADKMKQAKDEGIDPDTIIESAVAVAVIEIQAEQEQAALVNSGIEIDPALIDLINSATNENSINTLLQGKENETYYDQLVKLKNSRVKVIEVGRKKTKISTTIKAADSRNKNIEKKKQEADKLKGGIPSDVIAALDEADISSSEMVTALKAQYQERFKSEVKTSESISNYIDKLKSAYDLENKDLTSFVEEVDTLETIFTATDSDASFDISDSLTNLETVADTFELLESEDGTVDLQAAANLAQNAKEIDESKKLLTAAKDEGIDLKTLAKKDIKEQKAINKAVEDQKKSVEKQRQEQVRLGGALTNDLISTLDAEDYSSEESVEAIKSKYSSQSLFSAIEDYIDGQRKAYKLANADLSKLSETSATLAVLYESTEGNEDFDISDSLSQIDEVAETFELLQSEDGTVDLEAAANIANNAADIKESKKAIQRAKDAGIDATEIAKKDVDEQKAINKVAEKLEEVGGADAAKNFLASGAADDALQYERALEDDPDLANDIATAVNDTTTGEGEPGAPQLDLKAKIEEEVKKSASGKLEIDYAGSDYLSIIQKNKDRAQDISFALSFVEKGSAQEKALFANLGKLDAIMNLGRRFKDDSASLGIVFNNLDYADALNSLIMEFKNFPTRVTLVLENPELSPAVLSAYTDFKLSGSTTLINDLFANTESMKSTLSNDGINKLRQDYPSYESEILAYENRAGEIKSLLEQMNGDEAREKFVLENLADFDTVRGLSTRFQNSENKLSAIFSYEGSLNELKDVSDKIKAANAIGGQDFLFEHLDSVKVIGDEINQIETLIDLGEQYGNQPESMNIVFANTEKAVELRDLGEKLDSFKSDLLSNVDQLDVIGELATEFANDTEKMSVVFAHSGKAAQLRDLSKDLKGKGDDLLANVDQLDVIGELATEFANDTVKMSVVFANSGKAVQLRDLSKDLKDKGDELLANVDQLDVIGELATEFANDTEKMSVVFANSGKASQLRDLSKDLEGKGDELLANVEQLDVIGDLATEFANDTDKMSVVFANPGKAVQLRDLSKDLQDKGDDLLANVDQLDVIGDLATVFANDTEKMSVVFANSGKASQLRDLSKDLEGKGDELLANVDQLDVIGELATEFANDTEKMSVVFANSVKAVQLRDLSKDLEGKGDDLLANVDQLDVIGDLASEFDNDLSKLDVVFENPQNAGKIRDLSKRFGSKHNEILSAVDNIDEVENLANRFEGDSSKIETLFDNVDRVVDIKTLADKFDDAAASGVEVKPEDVLDNLEHLDDVLALDQKFDGEDGKLMNLYLNPEKAGSLKGLIDRYDQQAEDLIFNLDALDSIEALEQQVDGDSAQMAILLANPEKSNQIKTLSDRIGGNEVELLENVAQLDVIEDLTDTFDADSDSMEIIFANSAKGIQVKQSVQRSVREGTRLAR
jgi:hypothetical protein